MISIITSLSSEEKKYLQSPYKDSFKQDNSQDNSQDNDTETNVEIAVEDSFKQDNSQDHSINNIDVLFGDTELVTSSVLGATIANSNVTYTEGGNSIGGNVVQSNSFRGATGINAVNQNSGINANTQQSITVNANINQ